tara:strand:- start:2041 stop:2850 length:810 start_codon:yes stop_codon:yes gene_type:complete
MSKEKNLLLKEIMKFGILRLTLNDPKSKNALSKKMIFEMMDAISLASYTDEVKVIIIAASGDVYSAGHDLKQITEARTDKDNSSDYFRDLFESCSSLMKLIVECPKPIIAEINGIATAAGCQLVASCDLAISSDSSKFATPGVNIGLFCSTPMVALSRNVNKKDAMKMLLTGDMISAQEAKRISLINECVAENDLKKSVMDLAENISKKSSKIVKIGKEAFYNQLNMNLSDAYEYTSKIMAENILEDDAIEGINAFLEKRDANWNENNE